ncbi:major facilitator superfamily domain-containing protein 6 [Cydia amplana]|uniref:major facilitator superfamily domain-containing protein 6 n=1 Tax=Cydia amplana TaxID=1869771 RepID=UPI002FE6BF15
MVTSNMKVNKKLLPVKGHYFLFNAGTAPLVPYLSTYARQLGFSSATVGLIYTILPIFGLVAKPLFGVIADRFRIQKSIFILFQIVTIVSFGAIYLIPESDSLATVGISCSSGLSYLQSCYLEEKMIDWDKLEKLGEENGTATCQMTCDMTSPKMWQTICEHWHIPQYCYSATDSINYTAYVANSTVRDNCAYIAANNVSLEGKFYTPRCNIGSDYVDINEPCNLQCDNAALSGVIGSRTANMTCGNQTLNYKLCVNDTSLEQLPTNVSSKCEAHCDLDSTTPWRLMEICDGWYADDAESCQPKTRQGQALPSELSFTGYVELETATNVSSCVYVRLKNVAIPNGDSESVHYPYCASHELFQTSCKINCNNAQLNEMFQAAAESLDTGSQYTRQFWMFFVLMALSWVGMAVVVTFADAICFNILGAKVSQYGKQRLWGSVGWGIFSLLTGALIDVFSEGEYKNYAVAFVLMFVFMLGDVIVSCFIKIESTKMSVSILADVGTLLSSLPTVIFFLWTIAVGLCTGLLWSFLFWHLEDISKQNGGGSEYDKTLQGLVSAIQTFGGEIPFMFVSGFILKRLGHINMMTIVLFAFGVRFILYSLLSNAWWVLPIEMFQGITFGMFYPTMASYAKVVSPLGTETTVQGLTGAIFEGVGTSLGSFIGGLLYDQYGSWKTFLWFGIGSLVFCVVHVTVQCLVKDRTAGTPQGGYMSIIRYEQPGDTVCIMEDHLEGREMQLR